MFFQPNAYTFSNKKGEKDIFKDGEIICSLWNYYFYSSNDRKTNVHGTKGRRRIGSLERHVIIGYRDTNFGYYIRKAKRKLGSEMPPRIESEERIWQENLRCPQ